MKKITLSLLSMLFVLFCTAQNKFEALKLSNEFPQALQSLSFEYDQNLSPLVKEKNIDIVVYQFTKNGMVAKEPVITKIGTTHKATITIDKDATCLAFGFESDKEKDNNAGNGYFVPIYGADKTPIKDYYLSASQLYSIYGEYLFGVKSLPKKNVEILEQGLAKFPALENEPNYYNNYFQEIASANKTNEAKEIMATKIKEIESKETISAELYSFLANYYARNKNKPKADSLKTISKTKYPTQVLSENDILNNFFAEKVADKKVEIFESYLKQFPRQRIEDNPASMMVTQIATAYEKEKNTTENTKWLNKVPMSQKASQLNEKSWNMAEEGKDLAAAKKMSAEATFYAKAQYEKPTEKKPVYVSTKQWKKQRENQYAMYADTYAFILYKLGEYKEGLPYAKFGAEYSKLKDAEYNERYAMLLAKAAPAADAKKIIEEMVKSGKATPKAKDALKEVFLKTKKTDSRLYDDYLTGLEESAKKEKKAELIKSMINNPSPKFTLKDWDGKEVSLESLKGKVVVVDFWATWCGPCIQSMPGMKKAQEKFAGRDDVKFLFVDTWETAENKIKNAKDFMEKKNYPFYVLMDNENKMVSDFEVSGIPTKFILDKAGNIRFKSTGFEGNTDSLAEEVIEIVELLGATK
jgi:thiol-disulfide isomerase/thioredoxin